MLTFYDSGIGGLTIVKEYLKISHNIELQYFADIDFLPLGDKTPVEILNRTQNIATLSFENSKLLVLACNTASVNTIRKLQQNWLPKYFPEHQILSISKPITELLDEMKIEFKSQKLIILCTAATANSGFYQKEFADIGYQNIETFQCPGLCDLIEEVIDSKLFASGFLNCETIDYIISKMNNIESKNPAIKSYLQDLQIPKNSNIVLACTHYPIIKGIIKKVYPSCKVIDPSEFIAKRLLEYTLNHPEFN
jgi:glutamate racemase